MNYNKLSQEALEASNNKGFTFKSIEQSLALVISEICEAIEADRSNKRANNNGFNKWMLSSNTHKQIHYNAFKKYYKDTVEDEFADTAIRILLLAANLKIDISSTYDCNKHKSFADFTFAENAYDLISILSSSNMYTDERIRYGFSYLQLWSEHLGINLVYHIKQKMKYNKCRPMRHNKNY